MKDSMVFLVHVNSKPYLAAFNLPISPPLRNLATTQTMPNLADYVSRDELGHVTNAPAAPAYYCQHFVN